MKRFLLVAVIVLWGCSPARAGLTDVLLLESSYAYTLSIYGEEISGTETGTIKKEKNISFTDYEHPYAHSGVESSPFSVFAYSDSFDPCAATVEAFWIFRPSQAIQGISFDLLGEDFWNGIYISLFDETAREMIFADTYLSSNIDNPFLYNSGTISELYDLVNFGILDPNFNRSLMVDHKYRLSMGAYANSNWDSTRIGITINNMVASTEPIPEPSTIILLLAGMVFIFVKQISARNYNL